MQTYIKQEQIMQSGLFLVSLAQGAAECGVGGFPENPESNSVTKLERRHFSFSVKWAAASPS